MNDACKNIGAVIKDSPQEIRVRSINAVASLINLKVTTFFIYKIGLTLPLE